MEQNSTEEVPKASTPPKRTVTIKELPDEKIIEEKRENFIDRIKATSVVWKVASSVFLIGFLFHVISYGSPYWLLVDDGTGSDVTFMGLWCICTSISNCTFRTDTPGCLNSARGFGGVAILLCAQACLLLVLYVNRPYRRRCLGGAAIVTCGLAAISNQILAGIVGGSTACYSDVTSSSSTWSWCIAFSFISVVCFSVSAVLFWVQELRTCARARPKWRIRIGPRIRIT